jgi:hypothetical protein
VKRVAVPVVLAAMLAGCGGGGSDRPFTLAKTRPCLQKSSAVKIRGKLDFVASTATGGAVHVVMPHNAATVVFGVTLDDANNLDQAYHRFKGKNIGVEDVLRQNRNVVMLFHVHPSDDDLAAIEDCLS